MIPVFWRYLRIPFGIRLSTPLVLLAAVLIFPPGPGVRAQAAREENTVADGVYKFSLRFDAARMLPAIYPMKFTVTGFNTAEIDWATINVTGTAGFDQVQTREPVPAVPPASDALTWHGITLYGTFDVGVGWVSHGLPQNAYNYEGSSLVNRNANHSLFLIEPNNLSQTGLGVRARKSFRLAGPLSSMLRLA